MNMGPEEVGGCGVCVACSLSISSSPRSSDEQIKPQLSVEKKSANAFQLSK